MALNSARPRLCLQVEVSSRDKGLAAALERTLGVAAVASVLFNPEHQSSMAPADLAPLVQVAQARGAAALIVGDASLARVLKADGVHLPWHPDVLASYGEAREVLGGRYIVGADAGPSRHDAMSLGEAGADYVAFGAGPPDVDREAGFATQVELTAWWAEIFEIPVLALDVTSPGEAARLAAAGADFVSLRLPAAGPHADWPRLTADVVESLAPRVAAD